MMSTEQAQKFNTSDQYMILVVLLIGWSKFSLQHKQYERLDITKKFSVLVTQMLFCGETSGDIVKCLLFPFLFPLWDSEKYYVI